jgi:2-oxoisovalerate dehydrogenase E2 component (dihydrolipoyl transacylase)
MSEYLLPDVGEGLTEAEIVTWKVQVGDVIKINDIVVEIETAKSLVELPSPYAGTVEALLVPEGETVEVGTPIIRIGDGTTPESAPAEAPDAPGKHSAPGSGHVVIDTNVPPPEGANQTLVGYGPREIVAQRRARKGSASPSTEAGANTQLQVQGAFAPGGAVTGEVFPADEVAVPTAVAEEVPVGSSARVLAKPPVRKLAKDLGVDLTALTATGPRGSVSRADVEAATSGTSSPTAAMATTRYDVRQGEREWREPIKGVRKMMGQAMVDSAFTIPHVTEWITIDVTRTSEFVARLKKRHEFRDVKVSPLLVLARACCLAIRRTPEINSLWDEKAQQIIFKRYVNLGIAAATPRGLVVPNVKDSESMSLLELADALGALTATAREGRTQPAEMSGGTFTITNVGPFGVDGGTPIINPGESAILCFGAAKRQPWVVTAADGSESLEIRDVCTLSLSFDHRHIDGEKGSRFLADVAGIMEDPAAALLF